MQREEIKPRIRTLLSELGKGAYEREEVIALSLLSAVSGESIFLLGLPGVGKSMVARRLKMAFRDSRCFEYLMSRFSTPDEIFGPVSISKLKDSDTYERVIDGYLPTADVVFLDEIWKAGPAIQNSLLTAINEKIFHNGDRDISLPVKGIIAASNELPAEGEGLEALWDRFLIRYVVRPIRRDTAFIELVCGRQSECRVPEELQLSMEDYRRLSIMKDEISIPNHVMDVILALRTQYVKQQEERDSADTDPETKDAPVPYVSDRRWKKIAGILRTSALLNGRMSVDLSDCLLLEHMIWDNDLQIEDVKSDVSTLVSRMVVRSMTCCLEARDSRHASPAFFSPDGGGHYVIDTGSGLLTISAEDYRSLSATGACGRFTENDGVELCHGNGEFIIRSTRPGTVTINNFTYPLRVSMVTAGGHRATPEDVMSEFLGSVESNLFLRPLKEYAALYDSLKKVKVGNTSPFKR